MELMDVAVIAPFGMLELSKQTDIQLMLPHLIGNEDYRRHINWCRKEGDTIILDNGAAESVRTPNAVLLQIADVFEVSEFAIPDVMGNKEQTIERLKAFFEQFEPQISALYNKGTKFGFVAHGKDHLEAIRTIHAVMACQWQAYIDIVYLPRLLVKHDPQARVALAHNIKQAYDDRLVMHAFGASPYFVKEVYDLQKQGIVRSIDSSLPIYMGLDGMKIQDFHPADKIKRQDEFFDVLPDEERSKIIIKNVDIYLDWAEGVHP